MDNARFWVWWNDGWTKLTLRHGERLTMRTARATDEGWQSEGQSFERDAGEIVSEYWTDGVDCDGRLSTCSVAACRVDRLRVRDMFDMLPIEENRGIFAPEWERVDSFQRDYAAEAMGY